MVEKFEIKNIKITSCKKCANKISANWSYQMPSDTIQRVEEKEHRLKFMSFVCRSVDDGIVHAIGRSLACWLAHKFTCFLLRYAMCMNSFLSLSASFIFIRSLFLGKTILFWFGSLWLFSFSCIQLIFIFVWLVYLVAIIYHPSHCFLVDVLY